MPVSSVTEHWIKQDAITINLNHFGDPDYLQVSVLAGAVVMAFKQDVIGYNAAHNYRTWPLQAANTYLENTSAVNVYARLTRSEVNASALIIYDSVLRDIEGRSITYAEDGSEILGEADTAYFYIFLGQISSSVNSNGEQTVREWEVSFRFGNLDTNQYRNEESGGEWTKMFRLNKVTDMIDVLKTFSSAIFKRLFIGEKEIGNIQRSTDHLEIDDNVIPTTKYTEESYLSKKKDDRSKGLIASDKGFEAGEFTSGATGVGVYQNADGQWVIETDNLSVRRKFSANEVEIQTTNHIGGQTLLTAARMVIESVDEMTDRFRCIYRKRDGEGNVISQQWKVGDQAFCNTFNLEKQADGAIGNHYYWREVVEVSANNWNEDYYYVDLSKTKCSSGSSEPKQGDKVVQLGYSKNDDANRQNAIIIAGAGTGSPYIQLFVGIKSFVLPEPEQLKPGDNRLSGRLTIKEGSTGWENLEGLKGVINKQSSDLESFANSVTKEFENIRNEMDGAIDTWFGEEVPTLNNYPAVDWITEDDMDSHLGDLYYSSNGKAYRFQYTESDGYHWAVIEDSEVVKALELAQKALDTADGKRRVFIEQPIPPYDLGDLWAAGDDAPLMRCVFSRESGSFYEDDWDLADNSQKYADAIKTKLEQDLNSAKVDIDQAIVDATNASKGYTDEAKAAIQASINSLEQNKADLSAVYEKAIVDGMVNDAEADAIAAAKAAADAAILASETVIKAYADGIVSAEEQARITEAQNNLTEAKRYAEEKADEAFNDAEDLVDNLEGGKENLLRNTGFFGDYVSASLLGEVVLSETSEMYSPSLQHWTSSLATAVEMSASESGKGVRIENGGFIQQSMFHPMVDGEKYVFSFRGKGGSIKMSVGQYSKTFTLSSSFGLYFEKFVANGSTRIIKIEATGVCDLCELQLERGTIRSAWGMSPLDNQSAQAQYESMTYLKQAIEDGSSEFAGGLALANLLFAKDMSGNVKAGMSGIYNDDHSVAFFGGGNYEQAIATALKYANNPSYQASESEIQNMAKFVVTHGGRAILNDVVLRGYIYALGGKFKGEIEATSGVFKNVASPNNYFNIDENGNADFRGGKIGNFEVSGGWLGIKANQTEQIGTNSLMALMNNGIVFNSATRRALLGVISSSGLEYLGKFEDKTQHIASNRGLWFDVQNSSTANLAFFGDGAGVLNGMICGYGVQIIKPTDNSIYPIENLTNGNVIIVDSIITSYIAFPTIKEVRNAIELESGNFAVKLTVIKKGRNSVRIYGRGSLGDNTNYPNVSYMEVGANEAASFILYYDGSDYNVVRL